MSSNRVCFSGELLAASVLQRIFPAIAFPQTTRHYDILCETESGGFVKCQVKTTNRIETTHGCSYWRYRARKTSTGKTNQKYEAKDVDFFAFVCLPKGLIYFVEASEVNTLFMRIPIRLMTKRKQENSLKKISKKWNN
jgi:hypothetical protein